jgi:hypothetical protein
VEGVLANKSDEELEREGRARHGEHWDLTADENRRIRRLEQEGFDFLYDTNDALDNAAIRRWKEVQELRENLKWELDYRKWWAAEEALTRRLAEQALASPALDQAAEEVPIVPSEQQSAWGTLTTPVSPELQRQVKPEQQQTSAAEEALRDPPPLVEPQQRVELLPEPEQQIEPKEKKIRVDWNGYVKPRLFDRYDYLGLPDPDGDPDWRTQADAERWVENLCVPTGEGKPEAQIVKLRVESVIREHTSRLTKEYAQKKGWGYDKQKKSWTRITPEAGK